MSWSGSIALKSKKTLVVDSWAVPALLKGEVPAAARVFELVEQAQHGVHTLHMSWINLGEVYSVIRRAKGGGVAREKLRQIQELPFSLHEPNAEAILAAAGLKAERRIAYADAFAVALAALP
jgi:predicted nucleic acid-binding protein